MKRVLLVLLTVLTSCGTLPGKGSGGSGSSDDPEEAASEEEEEEEETTEVVTAKGETVTLLENEWLDEKTSMIWLTYRHAVSSGTADNLDKCTGDYRYATKDEAKVVAANGFDTEDGFWDLGHEQPRHYYKDGTNYLEGGVKNHQVVCVKK